MARDRVERETEVTASTVPADRGRGMVQISQSPKAQFPESERSSEFGNYFLTCFSLAATITSGNRKPSQQTVQMQALRSRDGWQ